ncbi:MAG: DsbA family protein [Chloroflexi bacterium]|nr:DsbA family protein [Chloroflexota bacterium]
MSRRQRRQPGAAKGLRRSRKSPQGLSRTTIILVVALALLIVGGLIFLSQWGITGPGSTPGVAEAAAGKTKGSPDSPVTIEVWSDFQCPYCRDAAFLVERQIEAAYIATGKAHLVYRHLARIGPESIWAAEAAECASEQGKFWEYHDLLFQRQSGENKGTFAKKRLEGFAAELGIDTQPFNACLDSDRYAAMVNQETNEGQRKGVTLTPTFFINGEKVEGAQLFNVFQGIIEAKLRS